MMHYHVITWQYVDDIVYSYVIEEPPETDDTPRDDKLMPPLTTMAQH